MKIYTRTGDSGSTGLLGGSRVSKDHARIEAYGTVDELNAVIGVARAAGIPESIDAELETVQSELFSLGAELAATDPEGRGVRIIGQTHIERLERSIDAHEATLPPLTSFILPAGTAGASQLHVARAVCRRAERRVVTIAGDSEQHLTETAIIYLNRLSDWLFVISRVVNDRAGTAEVRWTRPD